MEIRIIEKERTIKNDKIMKHPALLIALFANMILVFGQTELTEKQDNIVNIKKLKIKDLSYIKPKDFKYIEGGSYTSEGLDFPLKKTEQDSCLIMKMEFQQKNSAVASFFLSDHEVTNAEYRKFVLWVKEYSARKILAKHYPDKYLNEFEQLAIEESINWKDSIIQHEMYLDRALLFTDVSHLKTEKLVYNFNLEVVIDTINAENLNEIWNDSKMNESRPMSCNAYPDTLCWVRDFEYAFFSSISNNYFWHPAYDDHPVVGVTWYQAQAYCAWLSYRIAEDIFYSINGHRYNGYFEDNDSLFRHYCISQFRLPTENEFIYASMPTEKWLDPNFISKAKQQANFGAIEDVNGLRLDSYHSDGYLATAPIKNYRPNQYGIYDLHGNVSEWTSDRFWLENPYNISSHDDMENAIKAILSSQLYQSNEGVIPLQEIDTIAIPTNEIKFIDDITSYPIWLEHYAIAYLSNLRLIDQESNGKIVKGGNWGQGPVYLMPEISSLHSAESSRCTIGFRVALDPCVEIKRNQLFLYLLEN